MEDQSNQIQQNQAAADKLTESLTVLYQKLADVNKQQTAFGEGGQGSAKAYKVLIDNIDETTDKLNKLTAILGQQDRAMASAKGSAEIWSKAYDGATGKLKSMGEVLSGASAGFKPLADDIDKATKVVSPFKDAISKANQAYTTYTEGVASGKSRMDALKDVFPALTKGVEGGSGSLKVFKVALAETGVGLIVIAVAALMEKLQELKPVMDIINAVTASVGAVMSTLANGIVGMFTHPMDTIKNLGKNMANAAVDAYKLSEAQDQLKTSMAGQSVINDKLNDQIKLLKDQAENAKLTSAQRIKALNQQHAKEEEYYNQNSAWAIIARDNAVEELRIKTGLSASIVKDLKQRGAEAAIELLKEKKINNEQFEAIKKADDDIRNLDNQRTANKKTNSDAIQKIMDDDIKKAQEKRDKAQAAYKQEMDAMKAFTAEAEQASAESITRRALAALQGYDLEVKQTESYYDNLLKKYLEYEAKYANASKTYQAVHKHEHEATQQAIATLEQERFDVLNGITDKFREGDLNKLKEYGNQLTQLAENQGKDALKLAIDQATKEKEAKGKVIDDAISESKKRGKILDGQLNKATDQKQIDELIKEIKAETDLQEKTGKVKIALQTKLDADLEKLREDDGKKKEQEAKKNAKDKQNDDINAAHNSGDWQEEFRLRKEQLDAERKQEIDSAEKAEKGVEDVKNRYKEKQAQLNKAKLDAEFSNQEMYLKSVDKLSGALGSIFGKNTVAAKAAFKAHQAAAAGQVIIDTQKTIMGIWSADGALPIIGVPKAIVETAIAAAAGAASLATIIKQKPGFAQGGQYISDGRGALLPGYSRTDNTNAYLRSGEAVVVSEAMRNPWARNLVSAINVAHGGRDFSINNPGKGYAIGGIFTDGGNANRYYNQPANDVKDLANTLAYQMVNNFPPIYVDVKDVNNQQNILAQTINRVNL